MRSLAVLWVCILLVGCTHDATPSNAGPTPSSMPGDANDAGNADPGLSYINVANVAKDVSSIDLCVAIRGSGAWQGPILQKGTNYAPGKLRDDGVYLGTDSAVSAFATIEPGTYDFRLVQFGADCSSPLAEIVDAAPLLGGGGATVVLSGKQGSTVAHAFIAEFHEVATVRFLHLASGIDHVDFRMGAGLIARNLHANVGPGEAGKALGSPGGYVGVSTSQTPPFSIGLAGTSTTQLALEANFGNASNDAFLIGEAGSTTDPLQLLRCSSDLQRDGGAQACESLGVDLSAGPVAYVRFGNFPSVEQKNIFCLRPTGQGKYTNVADLQTRWLSYYVPMAAVKSDLKVVSGSDCEGVALIEKTGIDLSADQYASLILSGSEAGSPAPALVMTTDVIDLSYDHASLRFIHAAPSTADLTVGTGNGGAFNQMSDGLSYGSVSAYSTFDGLTDGSVTVRTSPGVDAAFRPNMYIQKGEMWTAIAVIGTKFNSSETELQVMVCNDTAVPISVRIGCRDARSGM